MEAAVDSPRSTGLALQLDDGTRKSHSFAQNSAFVTGFFRGIETKESFAKLVSTLYFVYRFESIRKMLVWAVDTGYSMWHNA